MGSEEPGSLSHCVGAMSDVASPQVCGVWARTPVCWERLRVRSLLLSSQSKWHYGEPEDLDSFCFAERTPDEWFCVPVPTLAGLPSMYRVSALCWCAKAACVQRVSLWHLFDAGSHPVKWLLASCGSCSPVLRVSV